jgi:poly(A) polymerase
MKMWSSQANNSSGSNTTNNQNLRTLGMTSAISMAEPKPSDLNRTIELKEALKPYNVFESEEELNHRMEILRFILFSITRNILILIFNILLSELRL